MKAGCGGTAVAKKGVVRKCGCARNQVWAVPALVSVRLPGRALHALLQLGGR